VRGQDVDGELGGYKRRVSSDGEQGPVHDQPLQSQEIVTVVSFVIHNFLGWHDTVTLAMPPFP